MTYFRILFAYGYKQWRTVKCRILIIWAPMGRRRQTRLAFYCLLAGLMLISLLVLQTPLNVYEGSLLPAVSERDLSAYRRSRNVSDLLPGGFSTIYAPESCNCGRDIVCPLMVLVCSPPAHGRHRAVMRATWASTHPTFFFMGSSGDEDLLAKTLMEAREHNDIIIGNYIDSYENLTLKTVHMLDWVTKNCVFEFLLKTDDDVLVNVWKLLKVLQENPDVKLMGTLSRNRKPHRDKESKWFLPHWMYREPVLPDYLSGTGYVINGEYAATIYEAALKTPLLNLEDVYLTGMVANKHLGYHLEDHPAFCERRPLIPTACICWEKVTVHGLSPEELWHIWPEIRALAEQYRSNEGDVCFYYRLLFKMFPLNLFFT